MQDSTITYAPTLGRIAQSNRVSPFTYTGTLEEADRAWLAYVRTFMSDPETTLTIDGHPDSSGPRRVIALDPGEIAAKHKLGSTIAEFHTHLNDPTCNGKYPQSA